MHSRSHDSSVSVNVLVRRAGSRFSTLDSRKGFTLRRHVVLLCLKGRKTTTHRNLDDELSAMPCSRDALYPDLIPVPSMLCKAFDRPAKSHHFTRGG